MAIFLLLALHYVELKNDVGVPSFKLIWYADASFFIPRRGAYQQLAPLRKPNFVQKVVCIMALKPQCPEI